jgi:Zn-dependent membrane protease YugP
MGSLGLAEIGLWLFAAVAVFQLVTLPVEFDASSRALRILRQGFLGRGPEMEGAQRVLTAAALTYVAALASTLSTIFYYLTILQGARSRE